MPRANPPRDASVRLSKLVTAVSILFQCLPRFRGKQRLVRLLSRLLPTDIRDLEVYSRALGQAVTLPSLKEPQALSILTIGLYEPETIEAIVRNLPANPVIVDVGANIGFLSLGINAKL